MKTTPASLTICVLVLLSTAGALASTHETTIRFDEVLAVGARVRVENLIGSVQIRGGDPAAGIRLEGRVLAEAKTDQQARQLAESVSFAAGGESDQRTIRVVYPTERHRRFRVPAVGFGGMLGKWVTPLVRKNTVSVDYGGRQVQVGQQRDAAAISVDLIVQVPFDVESSFRQVVGSIAVSDVRGTIGLEVIEGRIEAEQLFGSLTVASAGGDVAIRRFQGRQLEVHSGAGDVTLFSVRSEETRLTTDAGAIGAEDLDSGPLTLRTGSGDIELAQFESESFEIESVSGSVEISTRMRGLTGARIATATGDVVIRVATDRGFDVMARTKSGDITIYRMDLVTLTEEGRTISRRGRGGPTLDVATPGGKLTVRPDDGNWSSRMVGR